MFRSVYEVLRSRPGNGLEIQVQFSLVKVNTSGYEQFVDFQQKLPLIIKQIRRKKAIGLLKGQG